jgi:hypothetical protein
LGAENESTSRCDTAFSNFVGKERRSPSEASNEEIEESKAPMAREAHAEGARRKLRVEEQATARPERARKRLESRVSACSFLASWAKSSAVFPSQIKDLGLLATQLYYKNPFF